MKSPERSIIPEDYITKSTFFFPAAPPSLYNRQFGSSAGGRSATDDDDDEELEEPLDCATARIESAQEAMQGSEGLFIPECDREGRYLPVQCYKSEGYCWCVEPATGRPIPGTSTRHAAPQVLTYFDSHVGDEDEDDDDDEDRRRGINQFL